MIVFSVCVWSCANFICQPVENEYQKTVKILKYQLGYENTYSPVYSPYANQSTLYTAAEAQSAIEDKRMIYLTFDDGPSPRTAEILDILAKYNVKATFFVIKSNDKYTEYMVRAVKEGHTVGVHSTSHDYKEIYKNVDAFLKDFTECYEYVKEETGVRPTIFRFPGGSVNSYNKSTHRDIIREMTRRGFIYFDWNVESGDSGGKLSASTIYNNVINGCNGKKRAVIIMHDSAGKNSTVEALEDIIKKLIDDGWQFAALTNDVKPMIFKIK